MMKKKPNQTLQFAMYFDNKGHPAALEVGKLCRVIPDGEAAAYGYLCVVDESREDYAFALNRLHVIDLLLAVGTALSTAQT
jgi:hypothetical protein